VYNGQVKKVSGRTAVINLKHKIKSKNIVSITTIGKQPATKAESARQNIIWRSFYGQTKLHYQFFFQALLLSPPAAQPLQNLIVLPVSVLGRPLNPSQQKAVAAILSEDASSRIVMIQGPPGTGKTTVISAAVQRLRESILSTKYGHGTYLLAQSNIAVKNIAEKLVNINFLDFRILVSKEFHFDW